MKRRIIDSTKVLAFETSKVEFIHDDTYMQPKITGVTMVRKSDWEFINFSQDHEMDYILSQYNWEKNEENRKILRKWGEEAKSYLGRTSTQNITHDEFYKFILNVKKHKKNG